MIKCRHPCFSIFAVFNLMIRLQRFPCFSIAIIYSSSSLDMSYILVVFYYLTNVSQSWSSSVKFPIDYSFSTINNSAAPHVLKYDLLIYFAFSEVMHVRNVIM